METHKLFYQNEQNPETLIIKIWNLNKNRRIK